MFDVDTYRANAHHCMRMAEDPLNWKYKRMWLNMAETWVRMISEPHAGFEKAVHGHGTQQEHSKSRH